MCSISSLYEQSSSLVDTPDPLQAPSQVSIYSSMSPPVREGAQAKIANKFG